MGWISCSECRVGHQNCSVTFLYNQKTITEIIKTTSKFMSEYLEKEISIARAKHQKNFERGKV